MFYILNRRVFVMTNRFDKLRGLDTFSRFSVIFTRETSFVTFCVLSYRTPPPPSDKQFSFKENNLLPWGTNSFLSKKNPF